MNSLNATNFIQHISCDLYISNGSLIFGFLLASKSNTDFAHFIFYSMVNYTNEFGSNARLSVPYFVVCFSFSFLAFDTECSSSIRNERKNFEDKRAK